MIRRISRKALGALLALVKKSAETNKLVVEAPVTRAVMFNHGLNPHGCPWPGRVEARRRMGYTRRPKTQ